MKRHIHPRYAQYPRKHEIFFDFAKHKMRATPQDEGDKPEKAKKEVEEAATSFDPKDKDRLYANKEDSSCERS